jgi:hypothetical protein
VAKRWRNPWGETGLTMPAFSVVRLIARCSLFSSPGWRRSTPGAGIEGERAGRKNLVPVPRPLGRGVLPGQRGGHVYGADPFHAGAAPCPEGSAEVQRGTPVARSLDPSPPCRRTPRSVHGRSPPPSPAAARAPSVACRCPRAAWPLNPPYLPTGSARRRPPPVSVPWVAAPASSHAGP